LNNFLSIGAAIQKRRVFFSFHYQHDIWRANQVRNSWRYNKNNSRIAEGFYDGSIWETAQRTSDTSLKQLIRDGIKNTSVTCILAGSNTAYRRWVRYEIARSVIKQNGLLTVKIHNLKNYKGQYSMEGTDPLSVMGVYKVGFEDFRLAELRNSAWVQYQDYTQSVSLPSNWIKPTSRDVIALNQYADCYYYVQGYGSSNFASWVRNAALAVGR